MGKNELQQAAKDAAWRLLTAPLDQLVVEEWRADAVKEDTCLSHSNLLWEQFTEAACQKGIDLLTPPTLSNNGIDVDEIGNDRIHGKKYNNDDNYFNYHSSDGSAKEQAAAHGEFVHDAVGTSPMDTSGSKEGATCDFVQMDDTPNWLYEISNY